MLAPEAVRRRDLTPLRQVAAQDAVAQLPGDLAAQRPVAPAALRPLPVTIPQGGKALLLAAVLPPPHVAIELEVQTDLR